MRKVVMLCALILGTSVMVNANTIPMRKSTLKEVPSGKHKKHQKGKAAKTVNAAPAATPKK